MRRVLGLLGAVGLAGWAWSCGGSGGDAVPLGTAATARPLAPGVVSTTEADEMHPAFTPDGRTLYFVRRVAGGNFAIHRTQLDDGGRWSEPEVAPFSGRFADQEPSVSPDGRRIYFTSNRPLHGGDPVRGRDAWVAERAADGWGEPWRLEPPIRLERPDTISRRFWGQARGPVEDPDRRLWFWAERPGTLGHTDLYVAPAGRDGFGPPRNAGAPLNSSHYETGLAFGPDGSYMVLGRDAGDAGYGRGDLYVSFRRDDGWTEPVNLGPEVNTEAFEFAPVVSPGGRYLLFGSNRGGEAGGPSGHDIYVIEISAVEALARATE